MIIINFVFLKQVCTKSWTPPIEHLLGLLHSYAKCVVHGASHTTTGTIGPSERILMVGLCFITSEYYESQYSH